MIAILLSSDTPPWVTAFFTGVTLLVFYIIKSLFKKKER
jgi:hypothetical protein